MVCERFHVLQPAPLHPNNPRLAWPVVSVRSVRQVQDGRVDVNKNPVRGETNKAWSARKARLDREHVGARAGAAAPAPAACQRRLPRRRRRATAAAAAAASGAAAFAAV